MYHCDIKNIKKKIHRYTKSCIVSEKVQKLTLYCRLYFDNGTTVTYKA